MQTVATKEGKWDTKASQSRSKTRVCRTWAAKAGIRELRRMAEVGGACVRGTYAVSLQVSLSPSHPFPQHLGHCPPETKQ